MRAGARGIGIVVALSALLLATSAVAHRAEAALSTPSTRWDGTFSSRMTMPAGSDAAGAWPLRNYHVYSPPSLPAAGARSLVVYLPGTTQTAIDAANSVRWNDLADVEHFIVAYPEEATSAESGSIDDGSSDTRGWSWGRAVYEGRGTGEMRTIVRITESVRQTYGVDPRRVFIGGASAGAIMAVMTAATYPDVYAAVGSWAGCSYMCADATGDLGYQRMGAYARVVPSILFAGTADYLINPALSAMQVTGIVGMNDWADDGLPNNSVSRTPTHGPTTLGVTAAAASVSPDPNGGCIYASNSPCLASALGWQSYPYTVTEFGYASRPRDVVVESWVIHGLSHNYSGGSAEGTYADPAGPDTTRAAWRFFATHPRS